ncbi:hypothetical protein [Shinella sp. M31]
MAGSNAAQSAAIPWTSAMACIDFADGMAHILADFEPIRTRVL